MTEFGGDGRELPRPFVAGQRCLAVQASAQRSRLVAAPSTLTRARLVAAHGRRGQACSQEQDDESGGGPADRCHVKAIDALGRASRAVITSSSRRVPAQPAESPLIQRKTCRPAYDALVADRLTGNKNDGLCVGSSRRVARSAMDIPRVSTGPRVRGRPSGHSCRSDGRSERNRL